MRRLGAGGLGFGDGGAGRLGWKERSGRGVSRGTGLGDMVGVRRSRDSDVYHARNTGTTIRGQVVWTDLEIPFTDGSTDNVAHVSCNSLHLARRPATYTRSRDPRSTELRTPRVIIREEDHPLA